MIGYSEALYRLVDNFDVIAQIMTVENDHEII